MNEDFLVLTFAISVSKFNRVVNHSRLSEDISIFSPYRILMIELHRLGKLLIFHEILHFFTGKYFYS